MTELTIREHEIADLVAHGYSNRQIGKKLSITEQTVKNHVQSIFRKLALANRVQLTIHVTRTRKYPQRRFSSKA